MGAGKLKQIEEIYHAALEVSPHERDSFLRKTCGANTELRREVESLLSFNETSDNFLDAPPESLVAEMFSEKEKANIIGRQINQYKILALLGKGGMGAVYLAEDTKLDRRVAIKFLNDGFIHDAEKLNRFRREAKAASALNHPNILTVYEIGESSGSHYIATEFIDGKVLIQRESKDKTPLGAILDISIQIVSALRTAHDAGIVHRDIKPDNLMIRKDGIVKVLDFGLAKLVEKQRANESAAPPKTMTNPGIIMGTPNYMSPEQARGINVTHQTDIFSFGIVLYEMLAGKLPFQGESGIDVIGAILYKEPIPLTQILPQIPRDIESIVKKSLCKNTAERYQNTKDLLTDLQRVKQRLDFEEIGRSLPPEITKENPEAETTKIFASPAAAQINSLENAPPNNLSGEAGRLIGREAETAEITELLRSAETRLLTITGVGGTGKTRLAETIAQLSLAEIADGVYFIKLAQIADHELLVPIIAQNLGVREEGGKSLLECLRAHLRGKQMLIVLDNFEQITKAAPPVGELLEGLPDLKILVTSRVRLNLKLELEYTLDPLEVPVEKHLTVGEFGKFPAFELFVKRAKAAKADFALTEENAAAIAEICRRLDGLPLAIELAAARVKLFAPAAISKRLEKSLDLLTGGAKDLPARQQTMRGAIAWSYELLDADEKKLLNRLSVFRGGLTLEGADALGNPEADLSAELLDVISSLVDQSLLAQRQQADGEPRFRMLVVVREFAAEKLAESGETDEIRRRHAAFYAALAEEAEPDLMGAKAADWMGKLEQEHDNLRSALEWMLENQPGSALKIVGIIYRFWLRRGYSSEGRKWTRAALESGGAKTDPISRAKATRGGGLLSLQQGDYEASNSFIEESLRLSRQIGDKSLICYALNSLGAVRVGQGDLTAAENLTQECLAIAGEIDDKIQISLALNRLGDMARQKEDYPAARAFYEEAYGIAKKESINAALPVYVHNLAAVAYLLEDYRSSSQYALETLRRGEELGHKTSTAGALSGIAALAVKSGQPAKAARLSGAAQSIYEATGYKLEKTDQSFNDRYISEARAALGDQAFDAAYAEGRKLSIADAIALARQDEAGSGTKDHSTNDSLKTETVIIAPVNPTLPEISRPHNFFSQIRRSSFYLLILTISLLTAGGFFGYKYLTTGKQIKSIAVMPFVNESGNANDDYLSDGMTEMLIKRLSKIPNLSVKARSTVFYYKGKESSLKQIGRELNVDAVLFGRLLQRGDDLKLNLELVDTATENVLWTENYDRQLNDLVSLQSEIARDVSNELHLKLTPAEQKQIARNYATSSEAQQLYLRGRFHWNKRNAQDLEKAIEYFEQAVEKDPNYALAYAGLADTYALMPLYGNFRPQEYMTNAKQAALKALELDADLAEAHASLGRILNSYDFDWEGAEREFQKAIELNPNYATAHQWYAEYLAFKGMPDKGLEEISKALEIDPFSVTINRMKGNILGFEKRYDEAIVQLKMTEELYPENSFVRFNLGDAFASNKMYSEAVTQYLSALKLDGEKSENVQKLEAAYKSRGWKGFWTVYLENLEDQRKTFLATDKSAYFNNENIAYAYAATGNKDKTLEYLGKAFEERDPKLITIKTSEVYDFLRNEPRYRELIRNIGLPE